MKVILLEELPGKGGEGDVIEVADGFANNFLLRQGVAVKATPGNLKQLEERRNNIAKREEVRISEAEAKKAQLEGAKIFVEARVGDEGQLFGSVTSAQIAEAVQQQLGIELDKRRIELGSPIKVAGKFTVMVSLYREIKAALNVFVGAEPEAEEAPAEEVVEEETVVVEEAE